MDAKTLLNELTDYTKCDTVHMYIIERKYKEGAKPKDKPSEKFEYVPFQVNMSIELKPMVTEMLTKVIEKKVNDDVEIKEYVVIDDTENKIQTYHDLGKIAGFQEFLNTRLGKEIETIQSFEKLAELEKAWSICYGFYSNEKGKWLYCIKKLAPRNVAIDKATSTSVGAASKNALNSFFDLKTKTLKPLKGFSINIEPSIDMVYLDEKIYIFNKRGFEDITSLTEEFIELGKELIRKVEEIDFIEGMEHLSSLILNKPAFRNKMIKAQSIGNIELIRTSKNIKAEFNRAGKKINTKFKFDSMGKKIIANDELEAEKIILVISEYYKEGLFGQKVFETAAGRVRKNNESIKN